MMPLLYCNLSLALVCTVTLTQVVDAAKHALGVWSPAPKQHTLPLKEPGHKNFSSWGVCENMGD